MFWDSIHPSRGSKILSRPARWRMKCHTFWCHLLFSSIPMFFSHFLAFQCFLSNIPCHVQFLPEYISLVSAGPQLLSQINPDSHGSLGWATSEGGAYKYSWAVTQIQIHKYKSGVDTSESYTHKYKSGVELIAGSHKCKSGAGTSEGPIKTQE